MKMKRALGVVFAIFLLLPPAARGQTTAILAAINAACGGCAVGFAFTAAAFNPADSTTYRIDFAPSATPTQEAQAQAAVAVPPPPPTFLPTATVLGRMTLAEYTGIMQAAASQLAAGNGQLAQWLDLARTSQAGINPADPTTVAAIAALEGGGLLTSARVAVIFATP